ncbi:unnamed protein product [Dovyalis caffra]|uniref:Uncharacterized protein n=1 Tax=Dovyalis caffra TaxID=77055 RepID=A0AAV1RLH9_9ROSI|nr:unnamed protein product [Dovyalis caffra]
MGAVNFTPSQLAMMKMGLRRLMMIIKSKLSFLKMRRPYDKIEKSESMKVETRTRKARKLIDGTLRIPIYQTPRLMLFDD